VIAVDILFQELNKYKVQWVECNYLNYCAFR